ncbi:MAG: hypothetical protein AAFR73_01210 [Pseudomonadota bacterium]
MILGGIWSFLAALTLFPGNVVIVSHWGDALHLVDILERMSQGQVPHLDFVTPLGQLAFLPISGLMALGLPTGLAYLMAQLLLGAFVGAATLALALPRMSCGVGLLFAALGMVTALALVHGRPEFSLSVNVHYNRWGWALSFVALLAALVPPSRQAHWEGVLVGAIMAALACIKVTFFVIFLPVVVLGFLMTRQVASLIAAAVTGVGVVILLTAVWGFDYWAAYASDLLYVAGAERPSAGNGLLSMLGDIRMILPTGLVAGAAALMAFAGRTRTVILLLVLFLAGALVSDQNAGHDPLFLAFVALLMLVWADGLSRDLRLGLTFLAAGVTLSIGPNLANMVTSPLRAALTDRSEFVPLVAGNEAHQDVLLLSSAALADQQVYAEGAMAPLDFRDHAMPVCQSVLSSAYFATFATDLAERGLAQGEPIFIADYLSPLWMFGEHPPLEDGAPWSYGGLPGIEHASFVLVPLCPTRVSVYRLILAELEAFPMREVVRTDSYLLYRPD